MADTLISLLEKTRGPWELISMSFALQIRNEEINLKDKEGILWFCDFKASNEAQLFFGGRDRQPPTSAMWDDRA